MDQTVATADTPPVVLGRMPAPFVQSMGPALRHVAAAILSVVCLFDRPHKPCKPCLLRFSPCHMLPTILFKQAQVRCGRTNKRL